MGVTLPFLSFGGSSMVMTLGAMGVLMNVARQGN
jgi:cell division protein FtsW (lipid II flippase)